MKNYLITYNVGENSVEFEINEKFLYGITLLLAKADSDSETSVIVTPLFESSEEDKEKEVIDYTDDLIPIEEWDGAAWKTALECLSRLSPNRDPWDILAEFIRKMFIDNKETENNNE